MLSKLLMVGKLIKLENADNNSQEKEVLLIELTKPISIL
jgi:hypothetical protein